MSRWAKWFHAGICSPVASPSLAFDTYAFACECKVLGCPAYARRDGMYLCAVCQTPLKLVKP